jgi:hypothetical protein
MDGEKNEPRSRLREGEQFQGIESIGTKCLYCNPGRETAAFIVTI